MNKLSANTSTETSTTTESIIEDAILKDSPSPTEPEDLSFEELYDLVGTFVINEKLSIKKYKSKTTGPNLYSLVHFNFEDEIFLKETTFEDLIEKFPKIKTFNL